MTENSAAENRWTRLREIVRKGHTLWWTGGAIVLTALLFLMLWKVPKWQVARVNGLDSMQRFDRENEARKTLATILGGLVLLGGAYFTWRNIKLLQEGQITDRFTKAIEQLGAADASGKKKLEVRLGGIYALERIANQSERDHWPIVEVLSTYVRENAPRKKQESTQENQEVALARPAADIQAILTVLGRRDRKYERKDQRLDLANADIRLANLLGANLTWANLILADLSGAHLWGANLLGANLTGAHLTGASLSGANLTGASLREAHLNEARLIGADLSGADLSGADLSGADLSGAHLTGANLREAHLSGANLGWAKGLTQEQIDGANGDSNTTLPENLHMPERWKK